MSESEPVRLCTDSLGPRSRVWIAPRERTDTPGVDPYLRAVVFETEAGKWVGSAHFYGNFALQSLSEQELEKLLDQAIARG